MFHNEHRDGSLQLIAFQIGERNFCIDVKCVREIRCWTPVSELPHSPDHLLGVINLRGLVIAIMDLSARMGFGKTAPTSRNAIMVVELGDHVFGLLVDAVSEIFSIPESALQAAPNMSIDQGNNLVRGIIAEDHRMLALVDLNLMVPGSVLDAA